MRGCALAHLFCEDAVKALLEPCLAVLLGDAVGCANLGSASLSAGDAVAWSAHHTEEVGAEDLCKGESVR